MKPHISVVTPIYGVEQYIAQALHSLFRQSKTEGVEFILVDDCSTDQSMAIAAEVISCYPSLDIRVIHHSENRGLAAARQTGYLEAQGDYMIHIDSDDWCEPTMLEEMYAYAIETDADIVVADSFTNYPSHEVYHAVKVGQAGYDCLEMLLKGEMSGSVWNKLTKRSLFQQHELEWIPGIDMAEDWLIYLKVFAHAKHVAHLPRAFVHYRQNQSSLTNNLSPRRLQNYIDADQLAYTYLEKLNLLKSYRTHFTQARTALLNILIGGSRGELQRSYCTLYPEVTYKDIAENRRLPRYYKHALTQARQGNWVRANLIYDFVNLVKKIVR